MKLLDGYYNVKYNDMHKDGSICLCLYGEEFYSLTISNGWLVSFFEDSLLLTNGCYFLVNVEGEDCDRIISRIDQMFDCKGDIELIKRYIYRIRQYIYLLGGI
jgi:hypothetical protein